MDGYQIFAVMIRFSGIQRINQEENPSFNIFGEERTLNYGEIVWENIHNPIKGCVAV